LSTFDRRLVFVALVLTASLAGAVCSRQKEQSAGTGASATPAADAPKPIPDANLAAADMGGAVEELTAYFGPGWKPYFRYTPDGRTGEEPVSTFGPGFTGQRLIDGLLEPTWKWVYAKAPITGEWTAQKVPYPQEATFSFFERHPALIKGVTIVLPDPATLAPKDVEIWTSMELADNRFTRVAAKTIEAKPGEQTVSFDPVEAKFVKLRIVSGPESDVEIAEVRVIEGTRQGYTPLFVRAPAVKFWKGSPREAAQRGLDWLQIAAPAWVANNNCFGCHVQSQVAMGLDIALKHGYRVNMRAVRWINEEIRRHPSNGSWFWPSYTASSFGAMGTAYAADLLGVKNDQGLFGGHPHTKGLLLASADTLVERQERDGAMPFDLPEPPIGQGQFMTTSNGLVALKRAADNSDDASYDRAIERALGWIASNEPQTTQDKIYKIISLMHYGTPDQKRTAWSVVETLAAEQLPDGGWKENAAADGSSAFSTGQVLYAFKQAGVSIHGEMFRRGVDFLLTHQVNDPKDLHNGTWPAMHSETKRPSSYAPTMWAVIGLAGSYGAQETGALKIVKQQGDHPPTPNLLIVLDVSGSMNIKLGDTTRWKTALDVLSKVVEQLPEDMHVGLRVYGHRYGSKSAGTCTDTELVVPIAKLDRKRILAAASKLRPRGETPLIHSTLQTIRDLKTAGGGSVVLITDGEESCKGDAKTAAEALKASGLNITLNIVGFTITGQATQAELGTLAGSTGGKYYSAQDGAQLSRAVMLAALHRLPYDILDKAGKVLVSGQTSELSRELPPGTYRLRIDALGQVLEESITIVANQTTSLGLGVDGERFVIKR
jgi:hypothetical protein